MPNIIVNFSTRGNNMKVILKLALSLVIMLGFTHFAMAERVCLEWKADGKDPDFDLALIKGRDRILYAQGEDTLRIPNIGLVAVFEKTSDTEECLDIIDFSALEKYEVGVHHFGLDASKLRFVELFVKKKDGTVEVINDYSTKFSKNTKGDPEATPRQGSEYWELVPMAEVTKLLMPKEAQKPAPQVVEQKQEGKKEENKEEDPCKPGKGRHLQGCDYSNQSLVGMDFTGAHLHKANFSNSILDKAIFDNVVAPESNFHRASINEASFNGAAIENAIFKQTRAVRTTWNGVKCKQTDFVESDLEKAVFNDIDCPQANFNEANLSDAEFKDGNINKASFRKSNLNKATFKNMKARKVDFDEAEEKEGLKLDGIQG